ncbi:MAG: hypothetical protein EA367_06920 [Leptolyngbya sp. DLM2.Bin15]|nr:MAG: hypothetical protein EA367_06920 [Leptolyngbya sp. DLM2.Bin15]
MIEIEVWLNAMMTLKLGDPRVGGWRSPLLKLISSISTEIYGSLVTIVLAMAQLGPSQPMVRRRLSIDYQSTIDQPMLPSIGSVLTPGSREGRLWGLDAACLNQDDDGCQTSTLGLQNLGATVIVC